MARFEDLKVTKLRVERLFTGSGVGVENALAPADKIVTVTAGRTLTAEDHGKIFILGDAAPGNITLPAVTTTGFSCKVICGFAITSDAALISAEGDNIEGCMIVAGAVVDIDAADQLNFINTADNIGDWVEVVSDGTYWYANGNALTAGALTATG